MELPVREEWAVIGRFHGTSSTALEFRIQWVVRSFQVGIRVLSGEKNGDDLDKKKNATGKWSEPGRCSSPFIFDMYRNAFLHNILLQFSKRHKCRHNKYLPKVALWYCRCWEYLRRSPFLNVILSVGKMRENLRFFDFFLLRFGELTARISHQIYVLIVLDTLTSVFNYVRFRKNSSLLRFDDFYLVDFFFRQRRHNEDTI